MAKKECSDKKEVRNKKNSRDDFFLIFSEKLLMYIYQNIPKTKKKYFFSFPKYIRKHVFT